MRARGGESEGSGSESERSGSESERSGNASSGSDWPKEKEKRRGYEQKF